MGGIPTAMATDPVSASQISGAIKMAAQEEIQTEEALNQALIQSLDNFALEIKKNRILIEKKAREREASVSVDARLSSTLAAASVGFAGTEMTIQTILQARLGELNLIRPNSTNALAPYMIDPTQGVLSTNAQVFEIFMRFFCDPQGRNGEFANARIQTQRLNLGCGAVWTTTTDANNNTVAVIDTNVDSRADAFGENPQGDNKRMSDQLVNLPLRPQTMFFDADTFPVMPAGTGGMAGDGNTNTNDLAPVYYGAFAQAMHFLIGPPPDVPSVAEMQLPGGQARYNEVQATISRQMMATYPFAILFGERVGLMGQDAAVDIADVLRERFGNAAADPVLFNRIEDIAARRNISMAEYMDILMYQMPLSPGYVDYIKDLTPAEARREEVWLTALQTAVNYQIVRWLEIQAAIEAVKAN